MRKKKLSLVRSHKKRKVSLVRLPQYDNSFTARYLTWNLESVSPHTAHILGVGRFIILLFFLIALIILVCYLPSRLGYYWL